MTLEHFWLSRKSSLGATRALILSATPKNLGTILVHTIYFRHSCITSYFSISLLLPGRCFLLLQSYFPLVSCSINSERCLSREAQPNETDIPVGNL